MAIDWDSLTKVFLHDPPDKALKVQEHEQRAARYLAAALGDAVSRRGIKKLARDADQAAAVAERLPMPTVGANGERAVNPDAGGRLLVRHPLCPDELHVDGTIDEDRTAEAIKSVVQAIVDPRLRFFALWRLLPDRLTADVGSWFARLPAETRVPDHTLWHHADIAAGIYAASIGQRRYAFLSFQIGPVQPFIAAARSVRDLWSGSAILSWLTFQAMLPVIEKVGPTALVFPSLRGAPLMDMWLRDQGLKDRIDRPNSAALRAPSVPNRFLAVVPSSEGGSEAHDLAVECRDQARDAWRRLATAVRSRLDRDVSQAFPDWDRRWDDQITSFFDIRTACLPVRDMSDTTLATLGGLSSFEDAWPDAGAVRSLAECIPESERPPYDQGDAGRWQAHAEFASRLIEATRAVRNVPQPTHGIGSDHHPMKCSLFGSYEQMGPDDLKHSGEFWKAAAKTVSIEGVRLGKRDRLSAVALVKRFSAPAFLAAELGLSPDDIRIPDTWTVAAADWLNEAGIAWHSYPKRDGFQRWNGQWLDWRTQHDDKDEDPVPDQVWQDIEAGRKTMKVLGAERPPVYYAILKLDADEIGTWLRGEKTPAVRKVLHPKTKDYFEALVGSEAGLDARRPVGPALHAAISEALANFAVHVVPAVVARHHGTVIYGGGDDVLALLPVSTALRCAAELRRAFSGLPPVNGFANPGYYRADGRDLLMMGPRATLSAGLAILHAKDDLREGLEAARQAEETAKKLGRDALVLTVQRRSGERSTALADWSLVDWLDDLRAAFAVDASDRWLYRLRQELPAFGGDVVPFEAVLAEVRRQVDRSEEVTRSRLGRGDKAKAGELIARELDRYKSILLARSREPRSSFQETVVAGFLSICQSASFLARGRDG